MAYHQYEQFMTFWVGAPMFDVAELDPAGKKGFEMKAHGDESDEYVNDPENATICSINTICNIDPTIAAYFYADYGRCFGKTNNGWEEEF